MEYVDRHLISRSVVDSIALDQKLGPLGAVLQKDGKTLFRLWAPECQEVKLVLPDKTGSFLPMIPEGNGYHRLELSDVPRGTRYLFHLEGIGRFPDPVSRWQPEGVHNPSAVWFPDKAFSPPLSGWQGHSLESLIFYELHVGTFSGAGTFDGLIGHLDHLVSLGVTAIEVMPVASFPGERNWGYDGVYLFAVQESYGGPDGFARLVRACHERGLSVILDVVYNHLGPEGNYLGKFGPYFSKVSRTPWGDAINFDGPDSDHVRHFFLENLRYFLEVFDVDGFRFDAIHAIVDQSPVPFLTDVSRLSRQIAQKRGRAVHLIGESHQNDRRTVLSEQENGIGFDSQWSDDFHHALHVFLTGEGEGYYQDFSGAADLPRIYSEGFLYQGEYAPSFCRRRGSSPMGLSGSSFVVFSQNHDQVGNRPGADRLSANMEKNRLRLAAGLTLLSPFLPLLFMGEEFGEPNPFHYFTSHGDRDLIEAVREGRKREFAQFSGWVEHLDPQGLEVFERSRLSGLDPGERSGDSEKLFSFYRELIRLRKTHPALLPPEKLPSPDCRIISSSRNLLVVLRQGGGKGLLIVANLSEQAISPEGALPGISGKWRRLLDSEDEQWGGMGVALEETGETFFEKRAFAPFEIAVYGEEGA